MSDSNQPVATVSAAVANMRSGPGTHFGVIAQVKQGAMLNVIGRNVAGDWLQVCCVNNQAGWLWSQLLVVEGSLAQTPVLAAAAAPAPAATPTPTPPPVRPMPAATVFKGWKGEYFHNRDLSGAPVLVRDDADIQFHWGSNPPGPGLGGVNYSIRWTRTFDLPAGDYTFSARADDGVRVKLDGWTVVEHWQIGSAETYTGEFKQVGAGAHTLVVEYFQAEGDALVHFWFERAADAAAASVAAAAASGPWQGEYFANLHLQGPPVAVRQEADVNFQWGGTTPDPRLVPGQWSARWRQRMPFDAGDYHFFAGAGGGVRVYLNEWCVIDRWQEGATGITYHGNFNGVGTGDHTITVEYSANSTPAHIQFWLQKA